jgi:hypothetical protein
MKFYYFSMLKLECPLKGEFAPNTNYRFSLQMTKEISEFRDVFWYEANEYNIYTGKVFTTKELVRLSKLNRL